MKFKNIILDPNLLWKREAERFIELLFPNFLGFEIDIEQHEVGLADDDYVTIANRGPEKSYSISFNVDSEEGKIRVDFDVDPGFETAEYESSSFDEREALGYGTKLEVENFDLARLDDPTTVLQFNEFLKNGIVPVLE